MSYQNVATKVLIQNERQSLIGKAKNESPLTPNSDFVNLFDEIVHRDFILLFLEHSLNWTFGTAAS